MLQSKQFRFRDAIDLLNKQVEAEILSGIFIKKEKNSNILVRLKNRLTHSTKYVIRNEKKTHGYDSQYYYNMQQMLDSCYSQYERIGISRTEVQRLLKQPNSTALDYLKASKYSYQEIFDIQVSKIRSFRNALFMDGIAHEMQMAVR